MININIPSEFMSPAVLHRHAAGSYVDGEWVDGTITDISITASIQPLTRGDYRLLEQGNSSQRGWKVFWNGDFQFGIDGSLKPDELTYQNVRFKLVHKEEWQSNGYSAALFTEIK